MADPPDGAVTFLVTGIEGSPRLWDQLEPTRAALARHDALLRVAVEDNRGRVFRSVDGACFAAFGTAAQALAASLAAQRALAAEPWLDGRPLPVRMAIYSGNAELREGDYLGAALNRAVGLRDAAHAGQILLSQVACESVRGSLPDGVGLLDLGAHRLRDLSRPERVYQVVD